MEEQWRNAVLQQEMFTKLWRDISRNLGLNIGESSGVSLDSDSKGYVYLQLYALHYN